MSAELHRALETCRSRLQSARLLWRGGRLADAYVYGTGALQTLADAWGDRRVSLAAAGYRKVAELEETLVALEALSPPTDDRGFRPAHGRALERACASAEWLAAFTAGRLRSHAERRARLWQRLVVALATVGIVGVGAVHVWRKPVVSASAVYSAEFAAAQATDGLPATEWLLPGGQTGWLELSFRAPRTIRAVRLRNSHNRAFNDRATRAFRVTAYAGLQAVARAEGEFDGIVSTTPERRIPLIAHAVSRVRIEILSHFGAGAGLAEIDVE